MIHKFLFRERQHTTIPSAPPLQPGPFQVFTVDSPILIVVPLAVKKVKIVFFSQLLLSSARQVIMLIPSRAPQKKGGQRQQNNCAFLKAGHSSAFVFSGLGGTSHRPGSGSRGGGRRRTAHRSNMASRTPPPSPSQRTRRGSWPLRCTAWRGCCRTRSAVWPQWRCSSCTSRCSCSAGSTSSPSTSRNDSRSSRSLQRRTPPNTTLWYAVLDMQFWPLCRTKSTQRRSYAGACAW